MTLANSSSWPKGVVALLAVVGLSVAPAVLPAGIPAAWAATVTLPDMQLKVPTNQISVGTVTGNRQLQFTHITWDAGTGPFEIDPTYNSGTGTATFTQAIYDSPSPGVWQLDHSVPLPVTGVFDPP